MQTHTCTCIDTRVTHTPAIDVLSLVAQFLNLPPRICLLELGHLWRVGWAARDWELERVYVCMCACVHLNVSTCERASTHGRDRGGQGLETLDRWMDKLQDGLCTGKQIRTKACGQDAFKDYAE